MSEFDGEFDGSLEEWNKYYGKDEGDQMQLSRCK